jgi:hypothetical protein
MPEAHQRRGRGGRLGCGCRAVTNLAIPQRLPSLLVLCYVVADREVVIGLTRLVHERYYGRVDPVVTADT